jgi:hypothetical protein
MFALAYTSAQRWLFCWCPLRALSTLVRRKQRHVQKPLNPFILCENRANNEVGKDNDISKETEGSGFLAC